MTQDPAGHGFKTARAKGSDVLEIDVHMTEDGELVVLHDATVDRIPSSLRKRGFRPGDFTIPTLRDVLETFPRELVNIEIKVTAPATKPYERELAALLAEFGRGEDTIVVSFTDNATEAFKLFAPGVSTAVGTAQAALFWASAQGPLPGAPNPRHQALQVLAERRAAAAA